jgi:paraquat-inducible protein B
MGRKKLQKTIDKERALALATSAKKQPKAKTPSTIMSADINDLHACIEQDQKKLAKAYTGSLADIAKAIARATKAFRKEKKQLAKSKKLPMKKVDNKALQLQKEELENLKEEAALLKAGYKKFRAEQKILKQFEKVWLRKMKTNFKLASNLVDWDADDLFEVSEQEAGETVE